ncbi:MAG TPA: hypothetical protein VG388_05530 [Solirubrobacteraceae bacterium]|nr:hypothetical protein [Solirubrobacteraceae bacterium]
MARNDPPPAGAADGPSEPDEHGAADPPDPLRRLEERLERASEAAERLIAEAATQSAAGAAGAGAGAADARAADGRRPPPSGWQAPESEDEGPRGPDLDLLAQLLESLRDLVPSDLQQRLLEALRELLLAVRAVIDWYLERLDGHRQAPAEVQDIPIDWD